MENQPFRWNLTNRKALETLLSNSRPSAVMSKLPPKGILDDETFSKLELELEGQTIEWWHMFQLYYLEKANLDEMLRCLARVLALGADCDLVFVGRSPESLFDFLSGLLFDSPLKSRITLLQFSMRYYNENRINWDIALPAMKEYLTSLKLDPISLARRKRPVAFVDLVCYGETYKNLIALLKNWSDDLNAEWPAVRRKIRLIGITVRQKSSPKAVRWNQQANWISKLETNSIKNISVDAKFWDFFGNREPKATYTHAPEDWGKERASHPCRSTFTLMGLYKALFWFEAGRKREMRQKFASVVSAQPEMKQAALRDLVLHLRGTKRKQPARKGGCATRSRR